MFKVEWDKSTGGVLLRNYVTKETLGTSPRPVFYEELDLLGLKRLGWKYPKSEAPLMWCINKDYYYFGEKQFTAKGANIYEAPTVVMIEGVEPKKLKAVDMKKMLKRCSDEMFLAESEAIEFIHDVYSQYTAASESVERVDANKLDFEALQAKMEKQSKKKMAIVKQDCDSFDIMPMETAQEQGKKIYQTTKIDVFLASFSGGKDSQVVLDLCTRALPPNAFEVIYSDTGYELPTSLTLYEDVQKYYKEKYPDLMFSLAKNHESVLNYWKKIGSPSDKHRWCCAVMKTGPLYRTLKVPGTNKQAKVLTFEGVRGEESVRRNEYDRIGKGVKHSTTINARPIMDWNTTEVFLYLFSHSLPINKSYRYGKARVGCIICPYSTSWDDMIANKFFSKELKPFKDQLESTAKENGVKDIEVYIKERNWKFRSSGVSLNNESSITFNGVVPNLRARITKPSKKITDWLPVLGEYTLSPSGDGELKYNKEIYRFSIEQKADKDSFSVRLNDVTDASLIKEFKRVLYKATYCINCEVCEVECPTGALSVYPTIQVDSTKCIHCHRCLDFHDNGCIAANSLLITTEKNMKAKTAIDRYNTFGLREEWLDMYFADPVMYWECNGLGTKQVPAMKNWLRDAEIIDSKNEITELGKLLSEIYQSRSQLVWEIIWINLTHNSFVAQWYAARIKNYENYTKSLLIEMILEEFPNVYKERTVKNAVDALINTFKESPLGETFNLYNPEEKDIATRHPYEDISEEAVAYSLYKYGESNGITMLRIADLLSQENEAGIFREFGLEKQVFERALRTLNSASNRILVAELNMGLDHITLRENMTALQALKTLTE